MRNSSNFDLSEVFGKTTDSLFECVVGRTPDMHRDRLDRLIRTYGPPLTFYLTNVRRLHIQDAEELLQNFLLEKLIEPAPADNIVGQYLKRRQKEPGIRFRRFLLAVLRNFLYDEYRRKKFTTINLDDIMEPSDESDRDAEAEAGFDVAWANALLNQACLAVRAECERKQQPRVWEVFYEKLIRPIETGMPATSYEHLCSTGRFESVKQAANLYMTAIRKFNRALRETIANYLPVDGACGPDAVEAERQELGKALGIPGLMNLHYHGDFSIDENINTRKQQLLCIPEDVASLWGDEDLENLWRGLLGGSIDSLISEVSGKALDRTASQAVGWDETLQQFLGDASPSMSVLKTIKDVAKMHAAQTANSLGIDGDTQNVFPPTVTMLLYGTSIALARVRLNERITRDRDEVFIPRVQRLLEFKWIDTATRKLLNEWLRQLQSTHK